MRLRLYDQDMQEVKAMRQVRVAKQGQTHTQELIMAFAAGGASLFLVLAATRAFGSGKSLPSDDGGIQMAASSDPTSAAFRSSRSPLTALE